MPIGDACAMTCASMMGPSGNVTVGAVDLVAASTLGTAMARAEGEGFLCVLVPPPGPAQRGRLALAIEEAVEDALARRGAAPPGVGAASRLDATLGDQLYRARLLGAAGLTVAFPALEGIANLAGALDAEDSAVLRWWIAAVSERPLRLLFADRDRGLGVYGPPSPLATLLASAASRGPAAPESVPAPAPEVANSVAAMDLSSAPPAVTEVAAPTGERRDEIAPSAPERPAVEALDLQLDDLSRSGPPSEPQLPPARAILPPSRRGEAGRARADGDAPTHAPEIPAGAPNTRAAVLAEPPSGAELGAAVATRDETDPASVPVAALDDDPTPKERPEARPAEPLEPPPAPVAAPPPAPPEPPPAPVAAPPLPLVPDAASHCATWTEELANARGPKPLAVVERMFVSAYVPLRDALGHGLADPASAEVADGWAASFEHSYTEAFDALRLRGKRPSMVLDAPDLAQRLGRLHGARTVQLVVVDGMRFDLGLRVHERLRVALEQRAALAERLLLWAALPSSTEAQIDLIGRGPEGLKDERPGPESSLPVARGRAAATPRRVRAGRRDLLKLDLVAARLLEGAPLTPPAMDALAADVAESLAHCLTRLAPRTLALVFGDHGFRLDADGTPREGGASPDEVLVPAFAWLVGAVH